MTPDHLIDIYSRHAVYLEGAKTKAVGEFERFLKDMEADILRKLDGVDLETLKGRRLNALLKAVRKTLDNGFGNYEAVWRKQLEELAEYESGFTKRALQEVVDADFALPSPAQIMTAAFARPLDVAGIDGGSLLEVFFKNWTDKTKQRIEGAIRLSAAQGETLDQLIRRIRGTRAAKYADGLVNATRRDVALMGRTAYAHVANQARSAVYAANANVIAGEEFIAVLDGRTSVLCRSLSGRVFQVGKGPQPPLHIACRSMRVPSLRDGLKLLQGGGEQFSRGASGIKRVDADLTYYDWIKTQPAGFQDSVLGETRGKLLRDGGLTAKRFAELQLDKTFAPRTLDEIRALEPEAFAKAGL